MAIPRQPPARIDRHEQVRQGGLVEDPLAQPRFDRFLSAELRYDDERRGIPRAGELDSRAEDFARDRDAALDRLVAAVRHDEAGQRHPLLRPPHQSRREVRPVIVEVPAEERRHEERDHGDG